jgi:hypothetical protein
MRRAWPGGQAQSNLKLVVACKQCCTSFSVSSEVSALDSRVECVMSGTASAAVSETMPKSEDYIAARNARMETNRKRMEVG